MKYLARLVLSIENLLKNPVNWFDKQPWLLRMIVLLTLVPAISAASILSYQKFYQFSSSTSGTDQATLTSSDMEKLEKTLEKYHDSQVEEILYLREEVIELKQALKLSGDSDEVLGAQDSKKTDDDLRQRLEKFSSENLKNPDMKSAYIISDSPDVVMYSSPSTSSELVDDFEVGTFYPALEQKDNWQEIDFGDGNTAWIDTKYIIIFPIDENN